MHLPLRRVKSGSDLYHKEETTLSPEHYFESLQYDSMYSYERTLDVNYVINLQQAQTSSGKQL